MNKRKISWWFPVPALAIYTFLLAIPIIYAFIISATKWNGINTMTFVGFKNYLKIFTDKRLSNAVSNTLIVSGVVVVAVNVVGLFLATLLNKSGTFTKAFRAIFFLPYVLSCVAVSFVWKSIFSYTGVVNSILANFGIHQIDFLGSKATSLVCICIVEIWRTLGFYVVLYLASLQSVPEELYEACALDGGSKWDQFKHVTLPMIIPGATVAILLSIINELRTYDVIKIMTDGGPGYDTESVVYNIVAQGFNANALGYSCAIAVVLFIVICVITVLINRASDKLGDF